MMLPRATIGVSRWRRFRAAVDWPLIVTMVLLCTIGMLNLYSATRSVRHDAKFDKQVQWMVVGGIGFIACTIVDYRALVRLAWIGLGGAVALLLAARLFGHPDPSNHGYTYRWLNIAVLLVPIGLIAVQPDLGTAVLLTLIILTVGFLAMPNVWPMVYTTTGLLLAIPILWEKLHTYQKDRLLSFIDCNVAPTKTCWHTMQSIYAVGSGKIWGKGFLDGTQNRFGYVPENLTDFPFARLGEEWGFAGSMVLLAIFGFLLIWTLNVALSARDRIGSVICVGVAAMTFWHVIVNIAMVLGLAPVVGVTLPFISYGGSSLVTFFLAMGLVANVSLRKHGY